MFRGFASWSYVAKLANKIWGKAPPLTTPGSSGWCLGCSGSFRHLQTRAEVQRKLDTSEADILKMPLRLRLLIFDDIIVDDLKRPLMFRKLFMNAKKTNHHGA